MTELNPRLLTVASMVDGGLKTVDIGTDHAYLPVYLYSKLNLKSIIASDIGLKPLENAKKTLVANNLEDKIELRVSDGLINFSSDEVEQITICGMGGTLIRDILAAAPWIKKSGMRLILQPMTHSEDVRKYLCENGFVIKREECVLDTGRVYCCIQAVYTGEECDYPYGYYYFGELLYKSGYAKTYIKKQFDRVKKRADALKNAQRYPEEELLLRDVLLYFERMENSFDR